MNTAECVHVVNEYVHVMNEYVHDMNECVHVVNECVHVVAHKVTVKVTDKVTVKVTVKGARFAASGSLAVTSDLLHKGMTNTTYLEEYARPSYLRRMKWRLRRISQTSFIPLGERRFLTGSYPKETREGYVHVVNTLLRKIKKV